MDTHELWLPWDEVIFRSYACDKLFLWIACRTIQPRWVGDTVRYDCAIRQGGILIKVNGPATFQLDIKLGIWLIVRMVVCSIMWLLDQEQAQRRLARRWQKKRRHKHHMQMCDQKSWCRNKIVLKNKCQKKMLAKSKNNKWTHQLLKITSHGATWWRLPQPTATRRTEIKIYTSIDHLILIE